MTRVLAGDIGGTNARLAFFQVDGSGFQLLGARTYPSGQYASLAEIVQSFVDQHDIAAECGCFGVPGPVKNGRAAITNLPWVVEAAALQRAGRLSRAAVINDLEAQAYGIQVLGPDDFVVLNPGSPDAEGNAAIIAAGTGLGQAGLYWDGRSDHPFACEGGHTSFAPTGELQTELLEFLSKRFGGHVSWERVVSGPGLINLHDFLLDYRGGQASPDAHVPKEKDDPAEITESALAARCPLCVEAVDLFVRFYGAEAGNLGLKLMATGGVYLGGGIAPRIIEKLKAPLFREAFVSKGRMRSMLEAIPVRVIMNGQTALLGAARYAAHLM
ncbi:MAG TPA: glucokinase [Gemmatimonadota bacterium]|nr:glucokinase [Gemmatimonadota bacterium]